MKLLAITLSTLSLVSISHAQSTIMSKVSPQEPVPGLIARIYIGPETPTHLVAILNSDIQFKNIKDRATDLLRGAFKNPDAIQYKAIGFTNQKEAADLSFSVGNNNCLLNGKNLGSGTFTFKVPSGKRTLEITRKDGGQGQGGAIIIDPTTKLFAAFYTGEMLSRELDRSYKVDGKTQKSILLTAEQGAAANP